MTVISPGFVTQVLKFPRHPNERGEMLRNVSIFKARPDMLSAALSAIGTMHEPIGRAQIMNSVLKWSNECGKTRGILARGELQVASTRAFSSAMFAASDDVRHLSYVALNMLLDSGLVLGKDESLEMGNALLTGMPRVGSGAIGSKAHGLSLFTKLVDSRPELFSEIGKERGMPASEGVGIAMQYLDSGEEIVLSPAIGLAASYVLNGGALADIYMEKIGRLAKFPDAQVSGEAKTLLELAPTGRIL